MYHTHWGLAESPFRGCLDPHLFYESPTHEEALARLHFLVEQRRRLGLLMGPAGSGKSLLLEVFAEQLRRQGTAVARVGLLGLEPVEALGALASRLGAATDDDDSHRTLWRKLTDRLAEFRYQQVAAAILLDDVDQASEPTLQVIARLVQHDPSPDARLTLALAGQRERIGRIGPRLLDLAELRIDVEPWQPDDTADYVHHSLAQAGCEASVFEPPAVARLHELSHGIPRRVSQLADLSLLAGAGQQLDQIDAETVESVYREFGMVGV